MIGDLQNKASITGTIGVKSNINGLVGTNSVLSDVEVGRLIINHSDLPNYTGDYEVTPTVEEQTLPTKNKSMRDDLVVHEIPYFETSNLSGGYTAIIGG